jgi:hypothetical protein
MRGDFTRDSFDAAKRFRRVLLQQGRVQLDADFNEQTSILLRYGQVLATDLIGRFGAPANLIDANGRWSPNNGFIISIAASNNQAPTDLGIDAGRYYVDGIVNENAVATTFSKQPDFPPDPDNPSPNNLPQAIPQLPFLVYLEVFERPLAAAQDDAIAEPALEGLDTAARSRVVWQVKLIAPPSQPNNPLPMNGDGSPINQQTWNAWLDVLDPTARGMLRAMTASDVASDGSPCIVPISSAFRGEDNQLYRVEIHQGGPVGTATYKWSRENGSVIFPIETLQGAIATVTTLGRDRRFGLQPGDWVEITDDDRDLRRYQNPNVLPLFQVDTIKPEDLTVTLKNPTNATLPTYADRTKHPLLRRWERNAKLIAEVAPTDAPVPLENGVEIQFAAPAANAAANQYRAGDYWLIPARVALGDIIWPPADPATQVRPALPPHGIERHFAPLAVVKTNNDGTLEADDVRPTFPTQTP